MDAIILVKVLITSHWSGFTNSLLLCSLYAADKPLSLKKFMLLLTWSIINCDSHWSNLKVYIGLLAFRAFHIPIYSTTFLNKHLLKLIVYTLYQLPPSSLILCSVLLFSCLYYRSTPPPLMLTLLNFSNLTDSFF